MPSHSERVRRNYDPAERTDQRSQPQAPEWVDEGAEPIEPGRLPPIPLRDEDESNPVARNPS